MTGEVDVATEERLDCPMCLSGGTVLHEGLRDRHWEVPGAWTFRVCHSCGYVWLNPCPRSTELRKLYPGYYTHNTLLSRPGLASQGSLSAKLRTTLLPGFGYDCVPVPGRASRLGALLQRVPPLADALERRMAFIRGPSGGRLLDVGCGDGLFMEDMRSLGWEVSGIELDGDAAAIARRYRGLDVIEADVESAPLQEDSFDVVTMIHVLEHFHDPIRALEACGVSLKPHGNLVILTPNIDSLGHKRFRSDWMALDPPRHLQLFSSRTAASCLAKAGLDVLVLKTYASDAMRIHHASRTIAARGFYRLEDYRLQLNPLDLSFLAFEYALLYGHPEAGEELYIVATKAAASRPKLERA